MQQIVDTWLVCYVCELKESEAVSEIAGVSFVQSKRSIVREEYHVVFPFLAYI